MTEEMSTSSIPIMILKGLEGNSPTTLSGLQVYLASHYEILNGFWWIMFAGTLLYVIARTLYDNWPTYPHDKS